jgi:MarR family multiple antibiotic resistance transcriptional regulator
MLTCPVIDLADLFTDLVRVEIRLYNGLNERLRAEHGLLTSQFEVLRSIGSRDSCRVQDLADELAITVGATSKSVDRLEAAGWVRRTPNPRNRRSSLLVLTPTGQDLLEAATPTVQEHLRTWLATPLGDRALGELASAAASVRRTLEGARVGTPTG